MTNPEDTPDPGRTSVEALPTARKSLSLSQILAQNGLIDSGSNLTFPMSPEDYIRLQLRGLAIDMAQVSTNGLFTNDNETQRDNKQTKLRDLVEELETCGLLAVVRRAQNVKDIAGVYAHVKSYLKRANGGRDHKPDDANSSYCQGQLQLARYEKARVDRMRSNGTQQRVSRESTTDGTSLFLPESVPVETSPPQPEQEHLTALDALPLKLGQGLKRKDETEPPSHESRSQSKKIKMSESSPTPLVHGRSSSPSHLISLPQSDLPSRSVTSAHSTSSPQLISVPTPTLPQRFTAMSPSTTPAQSKPLLASTSLLQPSSVRQQSMSATILPPAIYIRPHQSRLDQVTVKRVRTGILLTDGRVDGSSFETLMSRLGSNLCFDPSTHYLRDFSTKALIADHIDLEDALQDAKEGKDLVLEIAGGEES